VHASGGGGTEEEGESQADSLLSGVPSTGFGLKTHEIMIRAEITSQRLL